MYKGDFTPGSVVDFMFATVDESQDPITFDNSPSLRAYKGNGTTEDDDGITLTVDFDGVTGQHHIRVDTSADEIFYAAGSEIFVCADAGDVDGHNVRGPLFSFSLNRASQLALASTLATVASNVTTALGQLTDIQARIPAALVGGALRASLTAADLNADAAAEISTKVLTDLQALAIDGTVTWLQVMKVLLAMVAGEARNMNPDLVDPAEFLAQDGATVVAQFANADEFGNRPSSVLFPP